MDRQNKLSIIQSLSDEKLTAALEAIGIDCGPADLYGEGGMGGGERGGKLDTWSSLNVKGGLGGKMAPLVDKSALFGQKPVMAPRVDSLGMQTPQGEEEALLNAGLM